LLLVAFLLVNAPNCHLSLVLASVVQGDAVNCNTCFLQFPSAAVETSGFSPGGQVQLPLTGKWPFPAMRNGQYS